MRHFTNPSSSVANSYGRIPKPIKIKLTFLSKSRLRGRENLWSKRVKTCAVFLLLLTMIPSARHAIAGEVIAVANIMNAATSQCLDSYWSSGNSGSDVKLYHCDGSSEQEWILEKVPYNTPYYNTGLIRIKNVRYPNLCLDVKRQAYSKGTPIWLYNCWSHTNKNIEAQLFDVTFSFYHTDYYSGPMSLGRISIEAFFKRGNSMLSTWIRPFFAGNYVFDIERGYTNGRVQLYPGHRNVMNEDTRPHDLRANQLFSLVATE